MKLQVDNREDKKILRYLEKEGIDYELTTLKVGDYLSEKFCVERKTFLDFVESYCNGHLQEQCENMELNFEHYYLFISGRYNYFQMRSSHYRHLSEHSINKMKLHLLHNYPKLRICEFSNDSQLVKGLKELMTYKGQIRTERIVRRTQTYKDVYLTILCSLPGISTTRAERISKKYPDLKSFIEGVREDENVLKGLAKTSKLAILQAVFGRG